MNFDLNTHELAEQFKNALGDSIHKYRKEFVENATDEFQKGIEKIVSAYSIEFSHKMDDATRTHSMQIKIHAPSKIA